jgi:hypothetical protein
LNGDHSNDVGSFSRLRFPHDFVHDVLVYGGDRGTLEEDFVKSPIPGRNDPERQFRSQLHTVLRNLERAIEDLMKHFWEEPLRRHAHEVSSALLEGCKTFGYLELASVTRAITSLLSLTLDDVLTLEASLREKFAELLGLLKEMAAIVAA